MYGSAFTEWPELGDGKVWRIGTISFPLGLTVFDPANIDEDSTDTEFTFELKNYSTSYHLYIYGQKMDSTWEYTPANYLSPVANLGGGNWTPTEKFEGFTINGYQAAYRLDEKESSWNDANPSTTIYYDSNLYLRYTRNQHKLTYISQGENTIERTEKVESGIYYRVSLSSYASYVPSNGRPGFAFVGWYADADCNIPFDFSKETMGDADVTVYAKWETQRSRIVLIPNAPEGEYSFANDQALAFRIDYNATVDDMNIKSEVARRAGYVLDCWYIDGTTDEWNFTTQVNSGVHGVNSEYQKTDDWKNNVYGDNDGEHENVVNILKLRAHWILSIPDNSVYVIYKVGDAYLVYTSNGELQTSIPVDGKAYVLNEGATSIAFQVADAPENFASGYVFKDWALLNSDGMTKSGETYQATSLATVESDYFKTETVTDDDGNTSKIRYVIFEAEFTPQVDKATVVIFNGNGGKTADNATTVEASYLVNKTFTILDNDTFTRAGYTFEEWNTAADGTGDALAAGTTVAADNLSGSGWDASAEQNIVYAIWTPNTDTPYTVEYYYQNEDGSYPDTASESNTDRTGTTDTTVSVTDNDKADKTFNGNTLVFDSSNTNNVLSANLNGDGSTVLKLYFNRLANVTIHHYLKGTITKVADDVKSMEAVASTINPATIPAATSFYDTYSGYTLTKNSTDPTTTVTVTANGAEIKLYYTLPLTITAKTDSKIYDGQPLDGAYTINGALASDLSTIQTALGSAPSITNVSESPKNYLTDEDRAKITGIPAYYNVSYTSGTLTITPITEEYEITVTGNSDTKVYNTREQSVSGYTVSEYDSTMTKRRPRREPTLTPTPWR